MPKYTTEFYDNRAKKTALSARLILSILFQFVKPSSVIDIGCGDGGWLQVLKEEFGVEDILGIDGPWINEDQLRIPRENFSRANLDEKITAPRRFDMAMSLEVAEHLPESRAIGFIEDLTSMAPLVLFSAAIPAQGGVNHVNEQWQDYWAEIFSRYSFLPVDLIRKPLWLNDDVTIAYRQNLLLYVDGAILDSNPKLKKLHETQSGYPLRIVHPGMLNLMVRRADLTIMKWLKKGPRIIAKTIRRKLDKS